MNEAGCNNPPDVEQVSISPIMVFTTPELLESILLNLDMRTFLISAVRVCRQWHDLIQRSISLQQALFLKSDEKLAEGHEVRLNPLLVELFPLLFDSAATPDPHGFSDLAIEALPIGRRRAAFYRLNASWRRMHLRHPSVRHVGLWSLDIIKTRNDRLRLVQYDEGLRMEDFYFLVLKHLYWWDLSVAWGENQAQQLPQFKFVRPHMVEAAEEMVRKADVTIGAIADDYCVQQGQARSPGYALPGSHYTSKENAMDSADCNRLFKMGLFWFKVKQVNHGKVVWKGCDSPCFENDYQRGITHYVWVHDQETNMDQRIAVI
ncbi:hypothetical protein N0V93_005922 [Gnomoniopsis smithogilvyi]|uniref:F-box domain-containing protein n=1 Tax=Gnomoniopsis smithogilvyi TaxID=1191159 RepID=A0A9W9CX56_9PEZI|nr:hypothetical protein N0V93_005922 [Gnomoniopsis smithogilvyi]